MSEGKTIVGRVLDAYRYYNRPDISILACHGIVDKALAAAHARGIAEGRALQAEEDARIAESDAWRYWWDGQHVKHCVAKAIREAAKIGDSNGPTA